MRVHVICYPSNEEGIFTLKVFLLDEFLGVFRRKNRLPKDVSIILDTSIENKEIYNKKGITGVY